MPKQVTLERDVRLFQNHTGRQLSFAHELGEEGATVTVLDEQVMHYDHCDQLALKVPTDAGERWILAAEAGIPLDA